jgi:protein transport protein HofC
MGADRRGLVGRATRRLTSDLECGTPLAIAVARHRAALPRETLAYVAVGGALGDEAAALRELSRAEDTALAGLWRICIDRLIYLAGVLAVMTIVVAFVMIRIVPDLRAIFSEFNLPLPALTEVVVAASQLVVGPAGLLVALCVPPLVLCVAAVGLLYLCDIPVLQPLADYVFRARHRGHVLRLLAMAAERRRDFLPVLQRLSESYPSWLVRRSLERAAAAATAGDNWRDALRNVRLIRPAEHALLGTAQEVGNLAWALRAVALRGERLLAYRVAVLVQIAYPIAILMVGSLVGFFVVAMFVPLVELIHSLTVS